MLGGREVSQLGMMGPMGGCLYPIFFNLSYLTYLLGWVHLSVFTSLFLSYIWMFCVLGLVRAEPGEKERSKLV